MSKIRIGLIKLQGIAGWTEVPAEALDNFLIIRKNLAPNDLITIGDWQGEKKDVLQSYFKMVKKDIPEQNHTEKNKHLDKINKEYLDYAKKIRSLSLEEKARRFQFFKLFWFGFNPQTAVPIKTLEWVYGIQKKFFKDNPNRLHCDPIKFKSVFKNNENMMQKNILGLIENIINSDIQQSKYNNK